MPRGPGAYSVFAAAVFGAVAVLATSSVQEALRVLCGAACAGGGVAGFSFGVGACNDGDLFAGIAFAGVGVSAVAFATAIVAGSGWLRVTALLVGGLSAICFGIALNFENSSFGIAVSAVGAA